MIERALKCESCNCEGNMSCGSIPINESYGCALHPDVLECLCCIQLGLEKNKERWETK